MKANRQDKIIEIIQHHDVETQEELAHLLSVSGFPVTQATISRDIGALHIKKIPDGKGGSKYAYPEGQEAYGEKFLRVFKDGYLNMELAGNIVVIKTYSGMAMAVAAALDHMLIPEIVGSIAGDDTIMCATKTEQDAQKAIDEINKLLPD